MVYEQAELTAVEDGNGNFLSGGISLPDGRIYVPETNNLEVELATAARCAGLTNFSITVNGERIESLADLPTNKISELRDAIGVEDPETGEKEAPDIGVEPYTEGGR